MNSVSFCNYTLRSRGSLNAVSQRREFHGALIKVNGGIGCVHPWPEFGDQPVDEQIKTLRAGGTSNVIERALRMAAVDGEARRLGVSLFAGLDIPRSHCSWDQNQPPDLQMRRVLDEGWRAIKLKGSRSFDETMMTLDSIAGLAGQHSLKMRIDFNSCLSESQMADFIGSMPPHVRERMDFIEDPFPYDITAWNTARLEFGVKLACDKGLKIINESKALECGYDFAVLKPGRREWRTMISDVPSTARLVMTSAMDHAVGQCFAAYEAAVAWKELGARMDLCGLCTEHLFERDAFFERISSHGGMLKVDRTGTGLGFDDIIEKLPWKKL